MLKINQIKRRSNSVSTLEKANIEKKRKMSIFVKSNSEKLSPVSTLENY